MIFSPLGQLWGNPIYNWEAMKEDGYTWWSKRLQASFELFDVVRIDHFRGSQLTGKSQQKQKTQQSGNGLKVLGMIYLKR